MSHRHSKEEVIIAAENICLGHVGSFLYDPDYEDFSDMDGSEARRYLESRGFSVVRNYNTGRNGIAITDCGIHLSTNGFIYKK